LLVESISLFVTLWYVCVGLLIDKVESRKIVDDESTAALRISAIRRTPEGNEVLRGLRYKETHLGLATSHGVLLYLRQRTRFKYSISVSEKARYLVHSAHSCYCRYGTVIWKREPRRAN